MFLSLLLLVPLQANISGSLEFSDQNFESRQWTRLNLPVDENAPRGSSVQTTLEPAGGNPQQYLNIAFDIPANRDGLRFTYLAVFLNNNSRYTPRIRGPILNLTYREDVFTRFPTLGPGVGQSRGLALRQNGRVYVQTGEFTQRPTTWTSYVTSQLRPANFAQVAGPRGYIDPSSQPDFSATGSEIEFGFWRGHTIAPASGSGGYPYYEPVGGTPAVQSSIGLDTWIVSVDFANALDDEYQFIHRPTGTSTLNVSRFGVLTNDRTVPGVRAVLDAPTSRGTVTLQENGLFTYSRTPDVQGEDLFTYHLELQGWRSNQATVRIVPRRPGLSCQFTPATKACAAGCAEPRSVTIYRDLELAPGVQTTVRQVLTYPNGSVITEVLGPFTTDRSGQFSFRPTTQESPVQFSIDFGTEGEGCEGSTVQATQPEKPKDSEGGCPLDLLLRGANVEPRASATLRQFRDERLKRHTSGTRLTTQYYRAAPSAVSALARNPLLAYATGRAVLKYLPLVEAAVAGKRPSLSEAERTEIADLLARFRESGAGSVLNEAVDAALAALYDPAFLLATGVTPPTEVTAGSPALRFSRLLGSKSDDSANAVAVDAEGNIYMTGHTGGSGFVTKLRPTGETIYETQFGGAGLDLPLAIAVDSRGNAYVAGTTNSRDLPVTAGALQRTFAGGEQDGFVLKLDPTGKTFLYFSYLGGAANDVIRSLQVAPDGSVFVAGVTGSANFPQVAGLQRSLAGLTDAFVARIDPDGRRLLYSTFFGGKLDETATGLALDPATGSLYLAGTTRSSDFPSRNGFRNTLAGGSDGFLAKLVPEESGFSLAYSTFMGGSGDDGATSVAVDRAGNPYLAGFTGSGMDFPLLRPAEWRFGNSEKPGLDGFAAKFEASSGALIYSTFTGGDGSDAVGGVAVDSSGNLYLAGYTESGNLAKGPAPQSVTGGGVDGLITVLGPDGSLRFRGPIGGSGFDLFMAAAVTGSGQLVVVGTSWSEDAEAAESHAGGFGGDTYVLSFDLAKRGSGIARATPALRWESELGIAVESRASVLAGGIVEGSSLSLVDASGKEHTAVEVLDSGPGRLEFVVGPDVAEGIARLRVTDRNGALVASGRTRVTRVAPAITLDGAMLIQPDGTAEPFSGEITAGTGPVKLKLTGTGLRHAGSLRGVFKNGLLVDVAVEPVSEHAGLEWLTLGPFQFTEAGEWELVVDADGVRSNAVKVRVR